MRYEENAAYPQALIICPENNHAEITYGSAWPLSHTLIPVQTCSCWNWLCSVQFKIFGKARAESDQGKAAIGPLPAFWNYGHTDINGKVCALKLSSRLWCPFYDFHRLVSCKREDPEGSSASLDCCWTISSLMAAVRARAVPRRAPTWLCMAATLAPPLSHLPSSQLKHCKG